MPTSTNVSDISGLATKAMLVTLAISQWGNRRVDRKITKEVNDQHSIERDMGRYNKTLIRKEALAEIGSVVSRARTYWLEQTLPWTDGGSRILPAANYWHYVEKQRVFASEFDAAVDKLVDAFPALVEDARARLNGAFVEADYPSAASLRRKYAMHVSIDPLPTSRDFRCDLTGDEISKIRADISVRLAEQFDVATRELFQRVADAVGHLRDRLSSYAIDPESGKISNPFRDTAVGNLREIVELLPRLNVTGNADLASIAETLSQTLCLRKPSDLRADEKLREASIKTADDILAAMADYIGDGS